MALMFFDGFDYVPQEDVNEAWRSMSITKRKHKEVRPDNGIECTCAEDGGDEEKCEKRWYCCDCGREMMHRNGDLFARCRECWWKIEANL
jgi:hypothetical protein